MLGKTLPFEDKSFDSVICVGVFCPCGAPPSSLVEFVRVCQPGGVIVFSNVGDAPYRNLKTAYQEEVIFPQVMKELEGTKKKLE